MNRENDIEFFILKNAVITQDLRTALSREKVGPGARST